ncbi:Ankyrin repeats (3 copies), putative [Angomonas deanei]|uniref:Ankyrin repeats (3 copies), putative n=1 Tax=Angomonas deanei TaxID=59799 RepID=A0A7G2CUP8_9TRYP|nr:Ankyrin repeats (3 copies), putative [Angomonas deanei]
MQYFLERQLAMDVYLPGTPYDPLKNSKLPFQNFLGYNPKTDSIFRAGNTNTNLNNNLNEEQSEMLLKQREMTAEKTAHPSNFMEACVYNNLQAAMLFLAQNNFELNDENRNLYHFDKNNSSPLLLACSAGHLSIVKLLLDLDKRIHQNNKNRNENENNNHYANKFQLNLNYANSLGYTPIHCALFSGKMEIVYEILKHNSISTNNVVNLNMETLQGYDAAFVAVQHGLLEALLLFVEDAVTDGIVYLKNNNNNHNNNNDEQQKGTKRGFYHFSFLPPTINNEALQADKELYKSVFDVETARSPIPINPRTGAPYFLLLNHKTDVEEHTLLHWAAYRNDYNTILYLYYYWNYDLFALDVHKRTPLIWAAREGHAETVEIILLLLREAQDEETPVSAMEKVNFIDVHGFTALDYAQRRFHREVTEVISELMIFLEHREKSREERLLFLDTGKRGRVCRSVRGRGTTTTPVGWALHLWHSAVDPVRRLSSPPRGVGTAERSLGPTASLLSASQRSFRL